MKARRSVACIDVSAELGIERDGSFEQECRHGLVIEAAGEHKRFVDGLQIVPRSRQARREPRRDRRARQGTSACAAAGPCAETARAAPWRGTGGGPRTPWHHDRAGVDQSSAHAAAREPLFSLRVAGVAIGARGHSQQAAVIVVAVPGQATPDIQPTVASGVRRRCRE